MAFRPPTFNLVCHIWRVDGVGGAYLAPDVVSVCNLSPGRRVLTIDDVPVGFPTTTQIMELLLPKGTDIRATWNTTAPDVVEVPQGSLRFYQVVAVDDVGKGFPNEYRLALMAQEITGNFALVGANTFPVPLP
jgi:hypothetical protein